MIPPDPLQFVSATKDPRDREIVGLIASSLAFGGVRQISSSIARVLEPLGEIRESLMYTPMEDLKRLFAHWRHRYVGGEQLCDMLHCLRQTLNEHGTLETCFIQDYQEKDENILPALTGFVARLRAHSSLPGNYLLPSPARGSACKRLNLFLRWMVRRDSVDPGIWARVDASKLIIPLDTHMHRLGLMLRLTQRRQANMRTALEITRAFAEIVPDDPVRYDFTLTRLGMYGQTDLLRWD